MNINEVISEYEKKQLQAVENAKKKERLQVNINPDSLLGREIKYQTAIEHEILQEVRQQTIMICEILREIKKGGKTP